MAAVRALQSVILTLALGDWYCHYPILQIYLSSKYLLIISYVPGTILGGGHTAVRSALSRGANE